MQVSKRDGIPLWQFELLASQPGLVHFISTRAGGVSDPPYDTLNLSVNSHDAREAIAANRQRLLTTWGVEAQDVATCTQVHGNAVITVGRSPEGRTFEGAPWPEQPPEGDALVTASEGVLLMLLAADCVPVILYDPSRRVVGVAHAGWSGTVQQVVTRLLTRMKEGFGSTPGDVFAGIGPSIGPCCYEVGQDVIERVRSSLQAPESLLRTHPDRDKAYLDLWQANHNQLRCCGVPNGQIEVAATCTRCNAGIFFSDRAQRPSGRFGAGIMLLPS
jgi:YfiH family protein